MKFVILIICFNLIGIYSKENLKPVPVHRPEKVVKVYRIIRPVRVVPAAIYRHGIEIQFVKDPITAPRELFTSGTTPIAKSPASFESFHTLAHVQRSDPITVVPTVSKTTTESSIVPIAKTSVSSDLIEALKLHLKTGLLTISHKEEIQRVMDGYLQAAHQLSKNFPDQVVEVQVEFNPPVKKDQDNPNVKNYRRNYSARKKSLRSQKKLEDVMTQTPTSTPTNAPLLLGNAEKVPIYLDDLKSALDDFSKKQAGKPICNHKTANKVKMHDTAYGLAKPHPHSLQDIMQLIGKGVKIQQNVPEPVEDDMDWLQIKLPSEVSA